MGAALTRYAFPVPEWTRTIWVSAAAQALWAPRLSAISQAFQAAERASVGPVRQAARQAIAPEQWPVFSRKAAESGLVAVALTQSAAGSAYQAGPASMTAGAPWAYTAALTASAAAARAFLTAWDAGDDVVIGELLGFPPCCTAFFRRVWVEQQWIDTTWPMVQDTLMHPGDQVVCQDGSHERRELLVPRPVEANILLRWLGLRWVPHLPCSFACPGTVALGQQFRALMVDGGHAQEAAWLDELLDSPVEWSAWHGIAEIKHPLFKISAKTDATAEKLVVRRDGRRYPEAAARGNVFPYRRATVHPLTLHRAQAAAPAREWLDNGFTSASAMAEGHAMIREALAAAEITEGLVLDLGAGTGRLLGDLWPGLHLGVEADDRRAALGRRAGRDVRTMTIAEVPDVVSRVFAVALISVRRFEEMAPADVKSLQAWLQKHAMEVCLYSYDDRDRGVRVVTPAQLWPAVIGWGASVSSAEGVPI